MVKVGICMVLEKSLVEVCLKGLNGVSMCPLLLSVAEWNKVGSNLGPGFVALTTHGARMIAYGL